MDNEFRELYEACKKLLDNMNELDGFDDYIYRFSPSVLVDILDLRKIMGQIENLPKPLVKKGKE